MKSAHDYRDVLHKGRFKYQDKNSTAVAYVGENSIGQPVATMYKGRAKKPSLNYRYRSIESLNQSINEFFKRTAKNESYVKQSRSCRELELGDVLRASWGYEQTNIDYYQVTELIGKTMVVIVEIAKDSKPSGQDHGKCWPLVNEFIGKPLRRRANGKSVSVDKVRYASKIEPKSISSSGIKFYGPSDWSSWH